MYARSRYIRDGYTSKCHTCGKRIVSDYFQKFCSRECYALSDDRKKVARKTINLNRAKLLTALTKRMAADAVDLTDCVFGEYRVLCKGDTHFWWCECSCGELKQVPGNHLIIGISQRCNRCRRKLLREQAPERAHLLRKRPFEPRYNMLIKTARAKNLEITLAYEDYLIFTEITECFYCHSTINWTSFRDSASRRSYGYFLDRIDNERGYSLDNVVVCCPRCNWGRANRFTFEEWYGMTAYFRNQK